MATTTPGRALPVTALSDVPDENISEGSLATALDAAEPPQRQPVRRRARRGPSTMRPIPAYCRCQSQAHGSIYRGQRALPSPSAVRSSTAAQVTRPTRTGSWRTVARSAERRTRPCSQFSELRTALETGRRRSTSRTLADESRSVLTTWGRRRALRGDCQTPRTDAATPAARNAIRRRRRNSLVTPTTTGR
jgi:hypothetical protein